MSYDYNALVQEFQTARQRRRRRRRQQQEVASCGDTTNNDDNDDDQQEASQLLVALNAIQTLSQHCPLTPLLWIQYAHTVYEYCCCCNNNINRSSSNSDNTKTGSRCPDSENKNNTIDERQITAFRLEGDILQLGIHEFPGSALLHWRAITVAVQQQQLLALQQQQQQQQQSINTATVSTSKDPAVSSSSASSLSIESLSMVLSMVEHALENVGLGSHRNEDMLVIVHLYRLQAGLLFRLVVSYSNCQHPNTNNNNNQLESYLQQMIQCWIQRSQVPMKEANHQLGTELQQFWKRFIAFQQQLNASSASSASFTSTHKQYSLQEIMTSIDNGRRQEAKLTGQFASMEDDIDIAMHNEGILARYQPEFQKNYAPVTDHDTDKDGADFGVNILTKIGNSCDWSLILNPELDPKYGMGYGGIVTATAFVRYAHTLQQFRIKWEDMEMDQQASLELQVQQLALAVYERAVAECPTVETVWHSYIRDLQNWIVLGQQQEQEQESSIPSHKQSSFPSTVRVMASSAAARMQQVTIRACRNCPYSVTLLQQKLLATLLLSSWDDTVVVVDPDQLLDEVQKGLDSKFIPHQPTIALDLYLTAIRVVKRRILLLLAGLVTTSPTTKFEAKKNQKSSKRLAYDDSEAIPNSKQNSANQNQCVPKDNDISSDKYDYEIFQEVQDLVEDLSEMYEQVESKLLNDATSNTEVRALLWKDQATTMELLHSPLHTFFQTDVRTSESISTKSATEKHDNNNDANNILLQSFEKCVRFHNPPHPDVYAQYIRQYIMTTSMRPIQTPQEVVIRIRQVRFLYEKALHAVGKTKYIAASTTMPLRDYETALPGLCNEWLDFERVVGSERSLVKATKMIEKKIQKLTQHASSSQSKSQQQQQPDLVSDPPVVVDESRMEDVAQDIVVVSSTVAKRIRDTKVGNDNQATDLEQEEFTHVSKKSKSIENTADNMDPIKETQMSEANDNTPEIESNCETIHKVRVGEMDYPAHPYTIRVSNLSLDVEDMDLVDLFRPKCGPIVHAKVVREKEHHSYNHHLGGTKAKSKGWGLIQFEERKSVEMALALDDLLGLNEKIVKVERSHMPAATLIPPGMHRIRPKGEGKGSKRNQKRRERYSSVDDEDRTHDTTQSVAGTVVADINDGTRNRETSQHDVAAAAAADKQKKSTRSTSATVLSFRPRGVTKTGPKRRLHMDPKQS